MPGDVICKQAVHGVDTVKALEKALLWDSRSSLLGIHDSHDPWGDAWPAGSIRAARGGSWIADGHGAAITMLRSDMEQSANVWGLRHWGARDMCSRCSANTSDMPWTEFSIFAHWLETFTTLVEWERAVLMLSLIHI